MLGVSTASFSTEAINIAEERCISPDELARKPVGGYSLRALISQLANNATFVRDSVGNTWPMTISANAVPGKPFRLVQFSNQFDSNSPLYSREQPYLIPHAFLTRMGMMPGMAEIAPPINMIAENLKLNRFEQRIEVFYVGYVDDFIVEGDGTLIAQVGNLYELLIFSSATEWLTEEEKQGILNWQKSFWGNAGYKRL